MPARRILNRLPRRPSRFRRAALAALALLLVASHPPAASAAGAVICSRTAQNTTAPSPFLCLLSAVVLRGSDCAALISETIHLPHSPRAQFVRNIPILPGVQALSNVTASVDGVARPVNTRTSNDSVRVAVDLHESHAPLAVIFMYRLKPAAVAYIEMCGLPAAASGDVANVVRWRSGNVSQSIDRLSVTFSSADANAAYAFVKPSNLREASPLPPQPQATVTRRLQNVSDDVEILAAEYGTKKCSRSRKCFSGADVPPTLLNEPEEEEGENSTVVLIVLFVAPPAFLMLIACACACSSDYDTMDGIKSLGGSFI